MVNLKQDKSKNGLAITAYTDNPRLLQAWKKQYPRAATVSGNNGTGIKFSVDKKYLKSQESLNSFLQPLYATASNFGEQFPNQSVNQLNNGENFMEKYETLNQKFQAHIGDVMQDLLKNGEIDEKTAQRLIMGYVPGGNTVYGLNYGGTNPLFILFQDKDATYVASEYQWEKYFNRIVVDKSHPIYVKTNTDSGVDIEKALETMGVESKKQLNQHQKSALHKNLANIQTSGLKINNAIVYDVRFTKVIDGEEDIFNQQAGLQSNIYGIENQAAKAERAFNNDKRNNALNNTYDDTQYRTINAQNIKDIRQSSKVMISNVNYFLRLNGWTDIANAKNFTEALNNLLTYQVNRDKNIVDKNLTKEIALTFLSSYFNIWQDGRKFTLPPNAGFNTKREYRACFYVIRQSCDVLLGRNFGLRGVTREETEYNLPAPQTINNVQEPTMNDFLNFMNVDASLLKQVGEDEPLNQVQIQNPNQQEKQMQNQTLNVEEEIKIIKEEFNSFLNRLNKIIL